MNARPIRLTVLQTHPVQYFAPWFRWIAKHTPDVELTVLYATKPDAVQQAGGFGGEFEWDVPLLEGYTSVFASNDGGDGDVASASFRGVDIKGIGEALRATRPDVVLIPGWHSITYLRALWWCRRNRVPTIWRGDSHGSGRRSLAWRLRTRALLRLFDYCLAVGSRTRTYLRAAGVDATRIFASPHHVDNERFALDPAARTSARSETRARFGIAEDEYVVAWVGKLIPHKRAVDVIDAVALLGSPARVLLIGDGPELGAVVERAARAGVSVTHAGFVNQQGMPAMYAAADVLAVTSQGAVVEGRYIEETWGLVMNEALAAGIPVVASSHAGGASDLVVTGMTGEQYPAGDIDALAAALTRVREGSGAGRYDLAACRAHVRRFSFESATVGLVAACEAAARPGIRVLALCGGLFAPTGMERSTFQVIRALRAAGMRVHCSLNDWPEPLWPGGPTLVMEFAESAGASWSAAPNLRRLSRSRDVRIQGAVLLDSVRTSLAIWHDMRAMHADRIFIPEFVSALRSLPALALARLAGRKVILKLPTAVPVDPFYRRVWRWFLDPVVSIFVANSAFTRQGLLDYGINADRVLHVPHAVPDRAEPITPRDLAADNAEGPLRILYIGQIIHDKGVHVLIDAVEICSARGVDVSLAIAGDITGWALPEAISYREGLQRRVATDGLADRVTFLGFREDIGRLMSVTDVHCAPSLPVIREAFGLVVIEAKQAGIPSIVFPSGGLPEHIRNGVDGIVCERDDAECLADAITLLARNPEQRAAMGRAAAESIARYDRATFDAAWTDIVASGGSPS